MKHARKDAQWNLTSIVQQVVRLTQEQQIQQIRNFDDLEVQP